MTDDDLSEAATTGGRLSPDVLVIGNGVAGYACAARAARHGLRPLLVGPGLPHDRPPLTKAALAAGSSLPLSTEAGLIEQNIERRDGIVEEVDLTRRRAVIREGSETIAVEADAIVLAVGLEYAPPPIPGLEDAHVNATPEGLDRLTRALGGSARSVVIVGAGLIGVETAATLAKLGHEVTVVEMEARPLHRLHDPISTLAESALRTLGVVFRGNMRIERAVDRPEGGTRLHLRGGETIDADLVIGATGGRQSRLNLNPALEFPISVDSCMRVPGFEGAYAIGDCAIPTHARFGVMSFPHWDAAHGMAARAADAIAGIEGVYDRLPYWWSDIGDLRLGEVGYAGGVATWLEVDGMHVGRDPQGGVAAVLVSGNMARLRDARKLMAEHEAVAPEEPTIGFEQDIKQLFREDDRRAMEYVFDLASYEDVRDWAPRIYERMEDGSMPCDFEWPPELLERFRSWMEQGCAP